MSGWYVTTSSFRGHAPGASHWYGEVGRDGVYAGTTPMVRVLDAAAARELSEPDFTFHAGDDTERFERREDVLAAAVAHFEASAQAGDQLFLGRDLGPSRTVLAVKTGRQTSPQGAAEMGSDGMDAFDDVIRARLDAGERPASAGMVGAESEVPPAVAPRPPIRVTVQERCWCDRGRCCRVHRTHTMPHKGCVLR